MNYILSQDIHNNSTLRFLAALKYGSYLSKKKKKNLNLLRNGFKK